MFLINVNFAIKIMAGFLFNRIVFGPVKSRRLGVSLGINLLPIGFKYCTFNCVYCECGWTLHNEIDSEKLHSREDVEKELEIALKQFKEAGKPIDAITFAGNGEPTIHPEFAGIVDDTLALRDLWMPNAKVSVLSNATMLDDTDVFQALLKVDNNILKLDAVTQETFQLINHSLQNTTLQSIVENLIRFEGKLTIQSLFVKGMVNDQEIDNTTPEEVAAWLKHIERIRPTSVMIYPIHRATPGEKLEVTNHKLLLNIAAQVEALGITTQVYE